MNNWFIKQADLNYRKPKILEFLKGKGIPEEKASEMIDTFGKADPTKDTTAEYINWIIRMVLTNKMKEEDIDKVREYLEVFSKLKKSNKLKELKVSSDINSYKDVVDLYKIVKDYLGGKPVTKQESERNTSYGLNKIYDKNGIKVYKITEPGVASYIAKDTNWCVKSHDTAKYYLSFGPLYLLETIGERYLISEGTDQFKNVDDEEVEEDFFNEMLPVLSELNIILRPNYLIENNLDEKYYPGQREEIKKYADINKALYDKEYEKAKGIIGQLKDENRIKSYKSILPNKMIYDGDIEGGIKLAKEFGSLDEQMIVNAHRTQVLNDEPLTYHIKPKKSLRLAKEDLLYLDKMIDSYAGTEIKDGGFLGLFGSRYPSKEEYLKVFDDSIDNYVNTNSRNELEDFIEKHKEIITPEIMDKVVDCYIRKGFNLYYLIRYNPEYFTPEIMNKIVDGYIRKGFNLDDLIQHNPEYFTPEIMNKVVDYYIREGFNLNYLIQYNPEYFTPEIMNKVVDYYIREGFNLDYLIRYKPKYFTPEIMNKVVDYYIKKWFSVYNLIRYEPKCFTPEIMDKVLDYYIREGFNLDDLIQHKPEYFTPEIMNKVVDYYIRKGFNLDDLIQRKPEYFTPEIMNKVVDYYIRKGFKFDSLIQHKPEYFTPEIMNKVVDYYIREGIKLDSLIKYKPEYFTPEIMDKVLDYYIREGFNLDDLIQRKPEYFTPEIMNKVVDYYIKTGFHFNYLIPYKPEYFTPEIMNKVVDYYIRKGFELDYLIRYEPKCFTPEIMNKVVDYYIRKGFELDYLIRYNPKCFTPEIMNKVVDYYIREGFKFDSLIQHKPEYFTHENLENLILKNIFNTKYYNAFKRFVDIKKIISKFIKNNINNTDGIKKVLKLYSINKDIAREILKENNIYSEDFLDSLYKESLLNPKWFIVKTAEKVSYIDYAKFGTVKLIVDDFEIDLVPPRKEVYQDQESRNPTVSYGTLQDDALRRDFTINSMYLDLSSNRIIDPTGNGINDIKNKIIRTTDENPDKIFSEDPLRMLRAIRQAYSFGFSIPDYVKESIKRNAYRLSILTEERFRDEFVKILQLRNAKQAIKDLKELGLLNYFLPELEQTFGVSHDSPYHKETIEEHILDTVEKYGGNLADKLVALFHDIGKPAAKKLADGIAHFYDHEKISAELAEKIMRKLKFPSDLIKEVSNRIRLHMRPHQYSKDWNDKTIRKFIKDMGEYLDKVIEFAEIDTKSSQSEKTEENLRLLNEFKDRINKLKNDVNKASQKLYNGNELMQLLNLKPGPDLKKVIEYLSELQLENPNITKDEALVKLKEFVGNGFMPKGERMKWFKKTSNIDIKKMLFKFIKDNFGSIDKALLEFNEYKENVNKKAIDNKKIMMLIYLLSLVFGVPQKDILAMSSDEIRAKMESITKEMNKFSDETEKKFTAKEIKSMKFEDFDKLSVGEACSIAQFILDTNSSGFEISDGSKIYGGYKEIKEDYYGSNIDSNRRYEGDKEIITYKGIVNKKVFKLEVVRQSDKTLKEIKYDNNNIDVNNLTFESFEDISEEKMKEIIEKYGPGTHKLKDKSVMEISKPRPTTEYFKGVEVLYNNGDKRIIIDFKIRPGLGHKIIIDKKGSMNKKSSFPSNPLKKVGDTGLTEKEVWEYYDKMKYKIFPYLKGHNVLLKIFTDDGVIIKRKDSDGKYLQINTIEDYDRWNGGRQEFHITLNSEESDIAWIDIDPKIDKSVDKKKIKNTCKELIKKILKNIYNLTKDDKSIFSQLLNVQVFYSGGRGYHIFLKFKQKMDINKVKETLKKCFENNIIPNFDNVKMGITKPGEIRLDLTTLHNLGSIRVPYSYNLSTGKRSKLLFKKNIV